jgi:hypothetical protein
MKAEECRRKAQRYFVRAPQMSSPANRVAMVDLAVIWMRLAEKAKRDKPITQLQQQQIQPKKNSPPRSKLLQSSR